MTLSVHLTVTREGLDVEAEVVLRVYGSRGRATRAPMSRFCEPDDAPEFDIVSESVDLTDDERRQVFDKAYDASAG